MFIKPLDLTLIPNIAEWGDKAGNPFFSLQNKKATSSLRSFFSVGSSSAPTITYGPQKKKITEFEYRIILKGQSKNTQYVVAIDKTFEKIHTDWNYVERNLFLKLAEMESKKVDGGKPVRLASEQIDAVLLRQFEEMTEESDYDGQAIETKGRFTEATTMMVGIFPNLEDEVLLNLYPCTYWANESASVRGQLFITRNYVCFHGPRPPPPFPDNVATSLCLPFKDVLSVDIETAKRLLQPDQMIIGIKEKKYGFSLHFHHKEVYRALCCLCDAAMNRLVKGAELSVTASSDMYAKGNTTGDLASNSVNRGGGLLMMTMGRSREELSFNRSGTGRSLGDFGEEDFTEQMLDVGGGGVGGNGSYLDDAKPNYRRSSDSRDDGLLTKTPFLYSHITTANINNMENLDLQLKSLEFRNLFRLPTNETVAVEETSCYYFQKSTLLSVLGNVYLSQDFLCFASLVPPYQSAIQNLPLASTLNSLLQAAGTANIPSNITTVSSSSLVATTLNSLLYDSTCELITAFVIPYPHITSVVKQPPTALPTGGKINTFSISGYLTITTKNKLEYWLSFSNAKSRDKITVELLTRMKNVDWRFDNDIIIGNRNGSIPPESLEKAVALKDSGGGGGSVGKKSTNARDFMFGSNNQAKTKIDLLPVGLRLIYDGYLDNGLTSPVTGAFILKDPKKTAPGGSGLQGPWLEYLEKNGRDTCMVKDLKMIRELIVRTGGIPNGLRGDFWMLFSGAWNSRPNPNYYEKLVEEKLNVKGPYTEEIEKDVRRSLPEYPAYQTPVGIDALRRILTSYSWRNPTIGYAQALNIISAVLLLHLREEDAFWMLCHIVERILPDHYTKTLVGSVVDQSVFGHLVQTHLPILWAHMNKIYLDLSTVSVPWFVCLFLNTVKLEVGEKILDCFFLDGPKFLFWFALAVLKINEKKLLQKGRDDDLFMRILKDYFQRLGETEGGSSTSSTTKSNNPMDGDDDDEVEQQRGESTTVLDFFTMKGSILLEYTLTLAYGTFSGLVTTDIVEAQRLKYRLKVVHQLDDSNRRSQTRTLSESVTLSFEEVGVIYDEVRVLDFAKEERRQHENYATQSQQENFEEDELRDILVGLGGWGMVKRANSLTSPKKKFVRDLHDRNSIGIRDFRKVFAKVSPWRSGLLKWKFVNETKTPSKQPSPIRGPPKDGEEVQVPLIDRIFTYCAVHYNFVHRRRGSDQGGLSASHNSSKFADDGGGGGDVFMVDLAAMVNILDIILKQPINARLRFLFDIHDVDGDGFLSKTELKAVMDSLLEMFEKARHEDIDKRRKMSSDDDEQYLRAVSSFLNSAFKLGNNKGAQVISTETGTNNNNIFSTNYSLTSNTISNTAAPKPLEMRKGAKLARSLDVLGGGGGDEGGGEEENDEFGDEVLAITNKLASKSIQQPPSMARRWSVAPQSNLAVDTRSRGNPTISTGGGVGGGGGGSDGNIFLSFNEFLLAILSQSVFVQFFERNWSLLRSDIEVILK